MSHLLIRGKKIWYSYVPRPRATPIRKATGHEVDERGRIPPEAKRWKRDEDDRRARAKRGLDTAAEITAIPLSQLWLKFKAYKSGKLESTTWRKRTYSFEYLLAFTGDIDSLSLEEFHLISFRDKLRADGYEDGTIISHLYNLNTLFKFAVAKRHMSANPITEEVRFKYTPKEKPNFSPSQLQAFFQTARVANIHVHNQTRFLLLTAFRSMDSCKFKTADILWEEKLIRYWNHKARRWEHFPLYNELEQHLKTVLQEHPQKEGFVFAYRWPHQLLEAARKVMNSIDLPQYLTIHSFKSNAGERWIESGMNAFDVAALMHHKSMQTTLKHYIKNNANRLRRLLNAELRTPEIADALIAKYQARIAELEAENTALRNAIPTHNPLTEPKKAANL